MGFVVLSYVQAFSTTALTRITVTRTSVPLEDYPFPSVTLCPLHSVLKNPGLAVMRLK